MQMKMYEIKARMEEIYGLLVPDEFGVIDDSAFRDVMDALKESKAEKLENSCRYYLNTKAEIDALKAEEKRLADRRKKLENRNKSLLGYLEYATDGQTTDCGIATVKYRTSKALNVEDARAAAAWLEDNGYTDLVVYAEPKISKNDVKKLINDGIDVPCCAIEEKRTCSVG
jgi:hypothetical protein